MSRYKLEPFLESTRCELFPDGIEVGVDVSDYIDTRRHFREVLAEHIDADFIAYMDGLGYELVGDRDEVISMSDGERLYWCITCMSDDDYIYVDLEVSRKVVGFDIYRGDVDR